MLKCLVLGSARFDGPARLCVLEGRKNERRGNIFRIRRQPRRLQSQAIGGIKVPLLKFESRSLAQKHNSISAMRFAIEDALESALITFDKRQSKSLGPQSGAVKFKGLRLIKPGTRLFEPTGDYVGKGRPGKIEWTWRQPRRLILCVGRTIELAEQKQRIRQIPMKGYIARKDFQRLKQNGVGFVEFPSHVTVKDKLDIQPVLLRHAVAQFVGARE